MNRPEKSKLYYPKMPAAWWLRKRSYFLFMIRELSSVFIALFLVVYLTQLYQLSGGSETYVAFARRLASPGWIIFHIAALLFAIYHSITWFQSTAVVMPIKVGEREVPRNVVTAVNVVVWIVLSLIIWLLFVALRG